MAGTEDIDELGEAAPADGSLQIAPTLPDQLRASSESGATDVSPGDCLGRYTVRRLIGTGGMGRVYAAVDPELGRAVALKLIRGERVALPAARARFLREAQVLAQLHHPNVVTIYDVATDRDRVFLAMELVEGVTLAEWLSARKRSWREVLTTFVAAGRGLAAVHAAGIVHRDFKPANVLVGNERVVVVDFGLARAGSDSDEPEARADRSRMLEVSLTATGDRVGTVHYMAPEQEASGAVTAKADQFSFCVALWEALHGTRALGGARSPDVPAWVNAAAARGLAPDPNDRWPSMDALLKALSRDRARLVRWLPISAASLALVGAAAWVMTRPAADPCAGSAALLAGVWDATQRDAAHTAFVASKVPTANNAWRGASARIDAYAARWVEMHTEACRATRVEGRQSDTLMDLRMACLERARGILGALTSLWARGMDASSVAAASDSAEALPMFAECSDTRALTDRSPLPADRGRIAQITLVRAQLDKVQALLLVNRWADARTALAAVRNAADATGWPQIRGEAAFLNAQILDQLQDPEAEKSFLEAVGMAAAARNDLLAARALVELIRHLAYHHNSADQALLVADIADGAVARAGDLDDLRIRYLENRGVALMIAGKLDDARAALTSARARATAGGPSSGEMLRALGALARVAYAQGKFAEARGLAEEQLAAATARFGPDDLRVADVLHNLGIFVDQEAGDHDAAAGYLRRALVIKEQASGPDTVTTALTLHALGVVETVQGVNLEEAARLLERTLAIQERTLGPGHKNLGETLENLSIVRRKLGRHADALAALARAQSIATAAYGPEQAQIAGPLSSLADTYEARGDDAAALDAAQRALTIRKATLGPEHPQTVECATQVARLLARLGHCDPARELLAAAAGSLAKAGDTDGPNVAMSLAVGARCDLADGKAAAAVFALKRAIAIEEKRRVAAVVRGGFRAMLARALSSAGARDEALAAARLAEKELTGDADGARDLAAVKRWLASRSR